MVNRRGFFGSLLGLLWAAPSLAKLLRLPDRRKRLELRQVHDAMARAFAQVNEQLYRDMYLHGQSDFAVLARLHSDKVEEFQGGTFLQHSFTYPEDSDV